MYHSTAVLLPDGRIVTAGGEGASRLNAQIYSPPYLFKGLRPVIADAPAQAAYGSELRIASPDAASVTSVAADQALGGHPRLRHEPALRAARLRLRRH